jgi:hypothetical protein
MARRQVTLDIIKGRCRINSATECWEWTNCVQGNGYGRINVSRKSTYVHRLAYTLAKGAIPDGKDICHRCDNRRCCNPDHLFAGSRLDNMQDAKQKGRTSSGAKHGSIMSPIVRARSKLSMEKAKAIRMLHAEGEPAKKLAQQFAVDVSNIRLVVRHKIWRESGIFSQLI